MRNVETGLARFSLGILVLYFPIETWASLPYGLWHPMYLVDFIAMCLLAFGGTYSLRARPAAAPGPLCAAWGWAAANGWRGTAWRWLDHFDNDGANLDHGVTELWVVTLASLVALFCFGLSLVLVVKTSRRGTR
jgi:hypothetical protein